MRTPHGDDGGWSPGHRRFEVLAVCTANLCRSPMVEEQVRHDLEALPGHWEVRSAGTDARAGKPVHPDTAKALAESGLALPDDWRSRQLTEDDVARADLVLTATRAHRSKVLTLLPNASSRVFTLRQAARLLEAARNEPPLDPARFTHPGDWLVASAQSARGLALPPKPEDDDLADPIGRPYSVFRDLATDVAELSRSITSSVLVLR